jgi:hypothetical protein
MNKTVILVWTKTPCNIKDNIDCNYWGLGDMIRGTIHMYNITKELGINFIVDTNLHSISKYLKKRNHPYEDLVLQNKDNVPFVLHDGNLNYLRMYVTNPSNYKDGFLFLMTNGPFFIKEIKNDCKEFIKDILNPNEELQFAIDEKIKTIPYHEYSILHYRFGDGELVRNAQVKHIDFLDNALKNRDDHSILLSDSKSFKQFMRTASDIFMLDTTICHLGHSSVETYDLKDTLIEFFITTKAKSIKTYTVHTWISGFVRIANIIYDVPLTIIAR